MCAGEVSVIGAQLPELQPRNLQPSAADRVTAVFPAPDITATVASATSTIATSILLSLVQSLLFQPLFETGKRELHLPSSCF